MCHTTAITNLTMRLLKFLRLLSLVTPCAIAMGCIPYHATTSMGVNGTIMDAVTHMPLPNARISFDVYDLSKKPVVAISGADGSFKLPRETQWQLRFLAGDYFSDLWIGGTVVIQHADYETNRFEVQAEDQNFRFHTRTNLGVVLLKPLSRTN